MQIGYDYSGFDATKQEYNNYVPEEGNYYITLIGAEEKQIDGKGSLIELEFVNERDEKSYNIAYLTGWTNGNYIKTREIAFENLGRIYYGITGNQPPANGFDLTTLFNGTFNANLAHDEYNGNVKAVLKNIIPIAGMQQAQGAAGNTAQPQQQVGAQVTGKPAWAQ